jgi:CubicO group peptidase (beta-lactamase class C family)
MISILLSVKARLPEFLRLRQVALLAAVLVLAPADAGARPLAEALEPAVERARALPQLRALIVAIDGEPVVERAFRGPGLDTPVNVKSVAKTVIAALVGAAIERGVLDGPEQRIAPLLAGSLPREPDPRLGRVTIGHLLSMQAGLERTSGANYGGWVTSPDWVRNALARPFVDEPGGRMLYSTGNSHLLSAILTRTTGRSTLALAREWLGRPLGIEVPAWQRDPQGIYLGGNNMALSPRALLALGELYRTGGTANGRRVFAEEWVETSLAPRTRSVFTGHAYGYGWFTVAMHGRPVHYAWGYGGQMLWIAPSLALTVVITSDPDGPSGRSGYARELHALIEDGIVATVAGAVAVDGGGS